MIKENGDVAIELKRKQVGIRRVIGMYFDPVSSWLVSLIADGIVVAGEKSRGGYASEYNQKYVQQANEMLNGDIRQIRNDYGLTLPEMAYERIQLHVRATKNSFSFQYAHGHIVIDLDNQEYIIALLEACSKEYSKYSYDEAKKKAEWYKKAAVEANRRKGAHVKQLEETRIRKETEREAEKNSTAIAILVTILLFIVGVILRAAI